MLRRRKGRAVTADWRAAGAASTLVMLLFTGLAAQGTRVAASGSWVKLPAPGESGAMAFVAIENPTMYGIYVTSATADAAGKVELRDGSQSGDARLKPIEFISVPAYDRVDMGPGGIHLMLIDLKRPLKEGDRVVLMLSTDNARTLEVAAIVRKE
jgi:periplasmic copper chaperone A